MTKKDYELIAQVFNNMWNNNDESRMYMVEEYINELIVSLQENNIKFNKEKFIAACYGEK